MTGISDNALPHFTNILYPNVGRVTIPAEINFQLNSELNATPPVFTLTCTSTGGPATTVFWTRGSTTLYSTSQTVTDTEEGRYMNTLMVAMGEAGVYDCTVSNNRSSDTRSLSVVGKDHVAIFVMRKEKKASHNHI